MHGSAFSNYAIQESDCIIAIGSRLKKKKIALQLINEFLKTKFEGGRHLRRIKKI